MVFVIVNGTFKHVAQQLEMDYMKAWIGFLQRLENESKYCRGVFLS
jgi:hypothetical protein